MNLHKKIQYNIDQAAKNKWAPAWFGCVYFDAELVAAIEAYQAANNLVADGLCGPSTYRRIYTERESKDNSYIIHHGKPVLIHWPKIVLWDDEHGLGCADGSYTPTKNPLHQPQFFITHWDVALSAKSCAQILRNRRPALSVHYCIDNDGTIYQLLDTGKYFARHAGKHNSRSIGVEVSCAYNTKYQSWYKRRGFGPRPIWKNVKVHGKTLKPFLGFYDVQIRALAALWEATSRACGIPLVLPDTLDTVDSAVAANEFEGYALHLHCTARKIDTAGLDQEHVLNLAKELRRLN